MGETTLSTIIRVIIVLVLIGILGVAFARVSSDATDTGKGLFSFMEDFKANLGIGSSAIALQDIAISINNQNELVIDASFRRAEDHVIYIMIDDEEHSSQKQTDEKSSFVMEPTIVNFPPDMMGTMKLELVAEKDKTGAKTTLFRESYQYIRPQLPSVTSYIGDFTPASSNEEYFQINQDNFRRINALCETSFDFCCSSGSYCINTNSPCIIRNNINTGRFYQSLEFGERTHILHRFTMNKEGLQCDALRKPALGVPLTTWYSNNPYEQIYATCLPEFIQKLSNYIDSNECTQNGNANHYSNEIYVKW